MSESDLITSALGRFLEVGGLVGRVGFSIAGNKALSLFSNGDSRTQSLAEMWLRNGNRIHETLGRLKGGAMKVGQMLSLQEGILPAEVLTIIRMLQQEAPPIPFATMRRTLEQDLPDYQNLFESIDPAPFASASIGQVHRGRLSDGREVAVKIQYPEIEKMIQGDLKNLRVLFRLLLSNMLKVDMDAIWNELQARLSEELDYRLERENQERFRELLKENPAILIPATIAEASGRRVLTTEYTFGEDAGAFDRGVFSQEERNHFGHTLFRVFLQQFLQLRLLHSDPNLANFAFRQDGKIVIYDFGSVKRIPADLAENYRAFFHAFATGRAPEAPEILKRLGIHYADGRTLDPEQIADFAVIMRPVFAEKPYCFGNARPLVQKIMDLKMGNIFDSLQVVFPQDIVFIHRTIAGLFGNLNRIRACGNWGEIARDYL